MTLFKTSQKSNLEAEFIRALYSGILLRDPAPDELEQWLLHLHGDGSLAEIVSTFVNSDEAKTKLPHATALFVPPGHFYSPIVDPKEIGTHPLSDTAPPPLDVAGIRIDAARMRSLWLEGESFLRECKFPEQKTPGRRYNFENGAFSYGDALTYYLILRTFRPKRLIEIGAGHSSACALDTIDDFLDGAVSATFIDPYPQLARDLLNASGNQRYQLIEQPIQRVDPAVFQQLVANDILFIDSTHVLKTGSDVNHELFSILPSLNEGVLIHFHDIFYPFEYGRSWVVDENRSWNEIYALRAFLMFNDAFEIVFFNDYFVKFFPEDIMRVRPDFLKNSGGSFWLRKTAPALPRRDG